MKKESKKATLTERIANALDIPCELLPHKTLVEIHGTSLVKIQGAGRILCYTENEIRISLRKKAGFLSVKGDCLCCNSYNMGTVGIEGNIRTLSFEQNEEDKK